MSQPPHPLIEHIRKQAAINFDDEAAVLSYFETVHAAKKEILIAAGDPCSRLYFVVKGCLRLFHLSEKGVEQTIQFALENWWLTDHSTFSRQAVTDFSIQAVEPAEVLSISLEKYEALLMHFPQMERYFRLLYQRAAGASQMRMKYQHDLSREGMYRQFSDHYPEFTQRIPQYLLASFLGLTPEYLSELRRRRS